MREALFIAVCGATWRSARGGPWIEPEGTALCSENRALPHYCFITIGRKTWKPGSLVRAKSVK